MTHVGLMNWADKYKYVLRTASQRGGVRVTFQGSRQGAHDSSTSSYEWNTVVTAGLDLGAWNCDLLWGGPSNDLARKRVEIHLIILSSSKERQGGGLGSLSDT